MFPNFVDTKTFSIFFAFNNLFFIFLFVRNLRPDRRSSFAHVKNEMKNFLCFCAELSLYAHDKILCDTHSSSVRRKLTTIFLTARTELNCVTRKICLAVYKRFEFVCIVVVVVTAASPAKYMYLFVTVSVAVAVQQSCPMPFVHLTFEFAK